MHKVTGVSIDVAAINLSRVEIKPDEAVLEYVLLDTDNNVVGRPITVVVSGPEFAQSAVLAQALAWADNQIVTHAEKPKIRGS